MKGMISVNGKVIGRILEVALVGEHGKIPDCPIAELPPFIHCEDNVEVTFTKMGIIEKELAKL